MKTTVMPPAVRNDLLQLREVYATRAQRLEDDRRRHGEALEQDSSERVLETRNDDVVDALTDESLAALKQIEHALALADAGRWGVCETCHKAIDPARLQRLPQSTQCAHCAAAQDSHA